MGTWTFGTSALEDGVAVMLFWICPGPPAGPGSTYWPTVSGTNW